MMNLNQLTTFVTVISEGSMTESCCQIVSHPAGSQSANQKPRGRSRLPNCW